jgi:hypothetical protein
VIKVSHLNIYVSESVRRVCAPTDSKSSLSSNASRIITQKLDEFPARYSAKLARDLEPPTFNLRFALGAAIYSRLSELAIMANLSISESCSALVCGAIEWSSLEQKPIVQVEEIPLPIGCLWGKTIGKGTYWYWRYYTRSGNRADVYMHKNRDRALAKARSIGIPEDANPKHRNRR